MRVVICGGGVIGACTAYFLARRGIDVIVIERTEVAAAASSKAGGFLALDWRAEVSSFTPPCLTRLRAIGATSA